MSASRSDGVSAASARIWLLRISARSLRLSAGSTDGHSSMAASIYGRRPAPPPRRERHGQATCETAPDEVRFAALLGAALASVAGTGTRKWEVPWHPGPGNGQSRSTFYCGPWQCRRVWLDKCASDCTAQGLEPANRFATVWPLGFPVSNVTAACIWRPGDVDGRICDAQG
jgi:hypothetical protein